MHAKRRERILNRAISYIRIFGHKRKEIGESIAKELEELKANHFDALVSLPTNLFMGLIWNMDDDVKELLLPKLKPYITDEMKKTMTLAIEEIKKVIG